MFGTDHSLLLTDRQRRLLKLREAQRDDLLFLGAWASRVGIPALPVVNDTLRCEMAELELRNRAQEHRTEVVTALVADGSERVPALALLEFLRGSGREDWEFHDDLVSLRRTLEAIAARPQPLVPADKVPEVKRYVRLLKAAEQLGAGVTFAVSAG